MKAGFFRSLLLVVYGVFAVRAALNADCGNLKGSDCENYLRSILNSYLAGAEYDKETVPTGTGAKILNVEAYMTFNSLTNIDEVEGEDGLPYKFSHYNN